MDKELPAKVASPAAGGKRATAHILASQLSSATRFAFQQQAQLLREDDLNGCAALLGIQLPGSDAPVAIRKSQRQRRSKLEVSREDAHAGLFADHLDTFEAAHWLVYQHTMRQLLTRPSGDEERLEAVEWIFADHVTFTDDLDGRTFRVAAQDWPFSFICCCIALDRDAESIRHHVREYIHATQHGAPTLLRGASEHSDGEASDSPC